MNCKSIGIIGRFDEKLTDGQTIKTRILRDELNKAMPESNIVTVELSNYKKKAFIVFFQVLICFFKCKNIFLLVSSNGMKFFFPFIYYINKIFKRNIIHDVIGGNLQKYVSEKPEWKKYLNSFGYNLVELDFMKTELEKLGVNNSAVVPNFKRLNVLDEDELTEKVVSPIKFCTFSRVAKEKGILVAVEAINKINLQADRTVAKLDIYGQVEENFVVEFNKAKDCFSAEIDYKGVVPYDKSTEILKEYDALLFPTTHKGEGFPGTIIDAYASGLPVIASNWKYNSYLIKNGSTGFIYDYNNENELDEILLKIVKNPQVLLCMKKNCLKEYEKYNPDNLIREIIENYIK